VGMWIEATTLPAITRWGFAHTEFGRMLKSF
jgi:hypothetical protein